MRFHTCDCCRPVKRDCMWLLRNDREHLLPCLLEQRGDVLPEVTRRGETVTVHLEQLAEAINAIQRGRRSEEGLQREEAKLQHFLGHHPELCFEGKGLLSCLPDEGQHGRYLRKDRRCEH